MLDFASVTDINIPQGDLIKIHETSTGRVLWEKKNNSINYDSIRTTLFYEGVAGKYHSDGLHVFTNGYVNSAAIGGIPQTFGFPINSLTGTNWQPYGVDDSGLINSTLITGTVASASTISITSIQTNLSQYLTFYNNGGGKSFKSVNEFPYLCATQELACINTFWTDAYKSIPSDKKNSELISLNETLRWNFMAIIKR